jgi:hypothetical protein
MRTYIAIPAVAAIAAVVATGAARAAPAGPAKQASAAKQVEATPLDLRALFVERGSKLVLSPAVEALRGKTVRVRGYMIQMEDPPKGAFYLSPRPVEQDESGGGTGDIPPSSVLVKVPGVSGQEIPWRPAPVEVVGTLEVGREEDAEGRVTSVRVVMSDPGQS